MRVEQQNQILEALQQAAGKDVKTASGIVAEKAKTTKMVHGMAMKRCTRLIVVLFIMLKTPLRIKGIL